MSSVLVIESSGDRILLESGTYGIEVFASTVNPSIVMQGFTYDIFITTEAADFDVTTTATFSGTGLTINSTELISSSSIKVNVTVAAGATLGYRDLTITGAGEFFTPTALLVTTQGATNTLKAGFQYTLLTRGEDIRRTPGVTIRDVLNNQANTATFRVDGTSNTPQVGEKIQILDQEDGDRLLFSGSVISVDQIYEDDPDNIAWETRCVDWTFALNKYRPIGKYVNTSVSLIVKDLIAKFAPGFTSSYVQTKLAKVSVTFDGRDDFATCLNRLAEAIGGGHWYVDYSQNLHFFHIQPKNADFLIPTPTNPDAPISYVTGAPATAMTVAESGTNFQTTATFTPGFYTFAQTYVYSNGVESALGPWSDVVALQGNKPILFSDIPVGPPIGEFTVSSRRIYYRFWGGTAYLPLGKFGQINNNSLTGFNAGIGLVEVSTSAVTAIAAGQPLPKKPFVSPPAGSALPPGVVGETGEAMFWLPDPPFFSPGEGGISPHNAYTFTPGYYGWRVVFLYREGTYSQPGEPTAGIGKHPTPLYCQGESKVRLSGIPIGPTIGDVDCIARLVYGCYAKPHPKTLAQVVAELQASKDAGTLEADWAWAIGILDSQALQASADPIPNSYVGLATKIGYADTDFLLQGGFITPDWSTNSQHWILIPDNTTEVYDIQPGIQGPALEGNPNNPNPEIPTWPNPDGPNPEDTLPVPDDITQDSQLLLHDPPFTKTIDMSQLRNRVKVRGVGTPLVNAAKVGATTLNVSSLDLFEETGGTISVGLLELTYLSKTAKSGQGDLNLAEALTVAIDAGEVVRLFVQVDDFESQKQIGSIEVDVNGDPTDGVHESMIDDTGLTTPLQLYQRAKAELELFSRPIVTIRYATRDPKTRSGARVTVDLDQPPCEGEFLIQDVTIDQIHDESDQLMPRYQVTASSVKYDLSDLLLKIITGALNDGVSFSGVTAAEPETSTLPDYLLRYHETRVNTGTTLAHIGWTFTASGANNISDSNAQTDETYVTLGTPGSGGAATWISPDVTRLSYGDIYAELHVKTAASDQSAYRVWAGLQASTTEVNSDTLGYGISFRYNKTGSASADNGNWILVLNDGTTQFEFNTGLAVRGGVAAGSHKYVIKLIITGRSKLTWFIDNLTANESASGAYNIPGTFATTTRLCLAFTLREVTNAVKNFKIARMILTTP